MLGRKSVVGIAVLCALAFSAFAAASAPAEQRAYTCAKTGAAFSDAHCTNAGAGSYSHVLIGATTEVGATNVRTASSTTAAAPTRLKGVLAGLETEISCSVASGMGELTNEATYAWGGLSIQYTGCVVNKPASKGCLVNFEEINIGKTYVTTQGQAAGTVKVSPWAGTEFGNVEIKNCSLAALNNKFPLTGSFVAAASGATLTTTHAGVTAQGTLKFGGQVAGLEGALTLGMGTPVADGQAITLT